MTEPAAPVIDPTQVHDSHTLPCQRAMLACRFSPDGRYLMAGGMQRELVQCQLAVDAGQIAWEKAGPVISLSGHKSWVAAIAFSTDGKRCFSADHTGLLHAWDFPATEATHQPAWSRPAHQGWVRAMAVSPDGSLLATCGNDLAARLWSTADGALVRELSGHDCHVYNVAFHPHGARLVTGDLKGRLRDYEVATGKLVREMHAEGMWVQQGNLQLGGVRGLAFSPDGQLLACGGMYGFGSIGDGIGSACVMLFDWEPGQRQRILKLKQDQRSFVNGVYFHPAGFTMAVAGGLDAGWLVFWRPGEDVAFHQHKLAQSGWSMHVHPDQRHFAVAHHDKCLRFYDLAAAVKP